VTDRLASVRRNTRAWRVAAVLALFFAAGHLPFLASTLEDVDSANFALGVRDFAPGLHRPHPPGYPIYIALGKAAESVLSEPHALSIWGVLFGALSAFALVRLFGALDGLDGEPAPVLSRVTPRRFGEWLGRPAVATALTLFAPLYWLTASRPMSDSAGVALSLAAQAVLVTAMVRQREVFADRSGSVDAAAAASAGRLVLAGAFVSALAFGFRSQGAWLTLPLLALVVFDRAGRGAAAALIGATVWFVTGTLLWLVPLIVASGGPAEYLAALGSQAGEDWTGVDLLVTNFTARGLAHSLYDTIIRHWAGIGWLMTALAALGAAVLLVRGRRALAVIVAAYAPYAIFHLAFQETCTTRYALPLVAPMAYLAARGLFALRPIGGSTIAACLAAALTFNALPATAAYSRAGSPVVRALADARAAAERSPGIAVGMHHPFARLVEAVGLGRAAALPAPPGHEWLELVKRWRAGAAGPVWYFADPRRTDLALVDRQAQRVRGEYSWPIPTPVYLGGIRPDALRWVEIDSPGWFAGEGWELTPETAGVARREHRGLEQGPITAWVRPRAGAATAMIGGRHLGAGTGPDALVSLRVDGREIERWTATAASPSFLRFVPLPPGSLAGSAPWSVLEIHAATGDGRPTGIVAIDQFDLQDDPASPMLGFGEGWQESEHAPRQGLSWRWASGRAVLRVWPADRPVDLEIAGESPRRYFGRASRVQARAGAVTVWRLETGDDFTAVITVPAEALRAAGGAVAIETDQTFRPADRGQGADRRELGLRIFRVTIVTPASSQGRAANCRTASGRPG